MARTLEGAHIAAMIEEGFEEVELLQPMEALMAEGARVDIVSPHADTVRSWNRGDWGKEYEVDLPLSAADPDLYDGLLLPGGVHNPDRLRRNEDAWRFVQAFIAAHRPVAAICHAPWLLIDAGVVDGRTMTSYPSLQTDLKNAGAVWVDEEVVVDGGVITSRNPRDIPAFNRTFIRELAKVRQGSSAG